MTEAVRTCVGCGLKAPQRELVRFAATGGELSPDPTGRAPGRGAYTCLRLACFERAAARGFERALRQRVRVPDGLVKLYEGV